MHTTQNQTFRLRPNVGHMMPKLANITEDKGVRIRHSGTVLPRAKRAKWITSETDASITHHRPGRARMDFAVVTELPGLVSRKRLAANIRQDIWRAAQGQRGFTPVVSVERGSATMSVTAGGHVDGAFSKQRLEALIQSVLDAPANRQRWMR